MVTQALSLSRSGLSDFIAQRVTAYILAAYSIYFIGFFVSGEVSHSSLTAFFWAPSMQIFSTMAILSIAAHAWVGMWTIGTDYLRAAHVGSMATSIRFFYQMICLLALFVYLLWSLRLVWQF